MCNSTNLVVVSGYIGAVSALRQTKTSGKDVLDFSVAVQPKPRRDNDGNWINQEPLWVKVVCWNGTAEYAEERAHSGRFVEVVGVLSQPEEYQSKKDKKHHARTVISAQSLNFIDVERKNDDDADEEHEPSTEYDDDF
jgi:single-strand DNA-binding protein